MEKTPSINNPKTFLATTTNSPSFIRRMISFLVLGFLCFSLSLCLYLFSFYALLDFFEFPMYSAFLDSPLIEPLVLSSFACILPPIFLIDTRYSFLERATRIFEIQAFLFLLLLIILSAFCMYTLTSEDAMSNVLYMFYFGGISRLLCCVYLYISMRLSIVSQKFSTKALENLNEKDMETLPTYLDKLLFFSQISGILIMLLVIFPLDIFGEPHFVASFYLVSLFFLFFYILYQLRTHPYKLWRLPYIIVCSTILILFIQHENLPWQAILVSFYIYQSFVFYYLYKKSENWYQ